MDKLTMADYSEDFFLDPGIVIKQEPLTLDNTINISASVPIPGRRTTNASDYHDLRFNITQSPSYQEITQAGQTQNTSMENTIWNIRDTDIEITTKQEYLHMDEDDIFKVDKADLIQGPTLAELNANDDTFLGDLNFDDLLLPEESSNYTNGFSFTHTPVHKLPSPLLHLNNNNLNNNNSNLLATSCPPASMGYYRDSIDFMANITPNSFNNYTSKSNISSFTQLIQPRVNSTELVKNSLPPSSHSLSSKHSTLHELLMKEENYKSDRNNLGQSVPGPCSPSLNSSVTRGSRSFNSRLSSSAPTHLGLDQIWQRREPRKHLLSTGSLAEAGSTSSLSTGGVLSPEAHDLSHDEQDYDEDSEHYEDFSSDDGDSDDDDDNGSKGSKKERYFWQYNVQAKGPKGQRLVMKTKMENPHVLNEVTDPVFSTECAVRGIKHSGKARKGDGNDLTPNPRKLYNIGKELDKLSRIINDMTPVSELPFNVRPKSRKEKNKLASRACRLKKKAQHEANKIKLHGLETEHKRLINGLIQIKLLLSNKLKENTSEGQEQLNMNIEKNVKNATKTKIAGQTTDYVNKILDKVKSGVSSGGLEDL